MTDKKIVLDTGAGANITMDRDKITITADDLVEIFGKKRGVNVHASGPQGTANVITGKKFTVSTDTITLGGKDVKISGTTLKLGGKASAELASGGPTTVSGLPLQLNGPGPFCARVTEKNQPMTILTGAALVLVGGPSFPFEVTKDGNDIKIGKTWTIKGSPEFQNKILARLGVAAQQPAQLQTMQSQEASGFKQSIEEFKGDNSFCEPVDKNGVATNQAYQDATPKGQPVYDGNGVPVNGPDGKQLIGTGKGSDTRVKINPDLTLPNSQDPSNPAPNDSILFHEMNHGTHMMNGTYDGTPQPPETNWTTQEEKNNILTGNPSEADYLKQRGYPWHRKSHLADDWVPNTP
jgi:hypothetical protein